MALEEIAVADIRKGQTILAVYNMNYGDADVKEASSFRAQSDRHTNGWDASETFYLVEDAPQPPPFEVPWETVQRDKNDDVWQFESEVHKEEGVIAYCDGVPMQWDLLEAYAPFTRLYTVQELIDILRAKNLNGTVWLETHRGDGII